MRRDRANRTNLSFFDTMNPTREHSEQQCLQQHTYQILTKRAERLEMLAPKIYWPKNIWMGVSVENTDYLYRINHLRRTDAAIKFLSLEPLLGPLERMDLMGINWVIAGGESGLGARTMDPSWVRTIRDQCVSADVAFHFKQWGGTNKKKAGRLLDDQTWDEFPQETSRKKNTYMATSIG